MDILDAFALSVEAYRDGDPTRQRKADKVWKESTAHLPPVWNDPREPEYDAEMFFERKGYWP